MDAQVEDDDVSDGAEHSDIDDEPQDRVGQHASTDQKFRVGIARVPIVLLESTADALRGATQGCKSENLQHAWMRAVAHNFPETPLNKLRATDPSLLPPWLIYELNSFKVLAHRPK